MTPGSQPIYLIAATAFALAAGTASAEFLRLSSGVCLAAAWGSFTAGLLARRLTLSSSAYRSLVQQILLVTSIALLAAARWTMITQAHTSNPLHQLAQRDDVNVVVDATISSVPVQHERPTSRLAAGHLSGRWQTRFVADCSALEVSDQRLPASATLRVFVDGQAARWHARGELVRITGRLSWPESPGNPGEFDFGTFLRRHGCAGTLFVAHPDAVQTLQPVGLLHPGYWLTRLRRAAQEALDRTVDPACRGIASALLLGSRTEIPAETEEVFIGSGTMHLLAISGLHIGILYLLLIRVGHWLLIPWNVRLVWIAMFCVFYAFMTDLRPSVVRATVFAVLLTVSQLTLRQVSLSAIIGQTASLMLLWQPQLVFDTGAWLSFLSVTGLAWSTCGVPDVRGARWANSLQEGFVPLTRAEYLRHGMLQTGDWLWSRYRPLLWIMAATIPLTAWAFHVVSPVGLMVNVLLIAWTMLTLWLGFAAVVIGTLIPFLPNLAGSGFSWMLGGLNWMVESAAGVGAGHLYLADLPSWFLPSWYAMLMLAVFLRRTQHRRVIWIGICVLTSAALWDRSSTDRDGQLHCTVLDIGHGSAAVVELPGSGVMLVDAGAMNRGDRAGDLVSRCLWRRGHRMIHAILVSHADVDHFNALGTILSRFPVGELLLSQQFLHNDSPAARQLVALSFDHDVPIRVVGHQDFLDDRRLQLEILQASPSCLADAQSDNEKSLVVQLRYGDRTIVFPGDLEGAALDEVLPQLSSVDVLVSPHHGSLKANIPAVAARLQPSHVIVSARDDSARARLGKIYNPDSLHFTSMAGAVRVDITRHGQLSIDAFRAAIQ